MIVVLVGLATLAVIGGALFGTGHLLCGGDCDGGDKFWSGLAFWIILAVVLFVAYAVGYAVLLLITNGIHWEQL